MIILKVKEFLQAKALINQDSDYLSEILTTLFVKYLITINNSDIIFSPNDTSCPTIMLKTRLKETEHQKQDPTIMYELIKDIYSELIISMVNKKASQIIFKSLLVSAPIYTPDSFEITKGIMARLKYVH